MSSLPRYKLPLGRRLTYRSGVPTEPDPNDASLLKATHDSTEWQFSVLEQDSNGVSKLAFSQCTGQATGCDGSVVDVSGLQSEGLFEITPVGHLAENATITPLANPTMLFPELPASDDLADNGWYSELQLDRTHRHFTRLAANESASLNAVGFDESNVTELDAVYLATRRRSYLFDIDRGIVTRVSTAFERNWPTVQAPSREVIQLVDDVVLNGDELQALTTSADIYFAAHSKYQSLIDRALWDVFECAQRLQEAGEVLQSSLSAVSHPTIRRWLERKLAIHNREYDNLVTDSQRTALAIDRPAPVWQAVQLDGTQCDLHTFRGGVAVLCFWHRGCSWSIRTLMALNLLAKDTGNRRVAFLGVCADQDQQSAQFVQQALQLNFPTILDGAGAASIAASYGVEGWPTVVVIDQEGVLRRHRAGYWRAMSSLLSLEMNRLESEVRYVGC